MPLAGSGVRRPLAMPIEIGLVLQQGGGVIVVFGLAEPLPIEPQRIVILRQLVCALLQPLVLLAFGFGHGSQRLIVPDCLPSLPSRGSRYPDPGAHRTPHFVHALLPGGSSSTESVIVDGPGAPPTRPAFLARVRLR